jgi:hypothetical protein
MFQQVRVIAADCAIPYQDLIKVWVAEKLLARERAARPTPLDDR